MKLKNKLLAAGVACALMLGTPGFTDSTVYAEEIQSAAVMEVDARTQLIDSLASLRDMDNGTLAFKIDFNSPIFGGDMTGTCDFVSKPVFVSKGSSEVVMKVADVPNGAVKYNFYCRETAKNVEFYSQNQNGSWDKYVYGKVDDKAMEAALQKSLTVDMPDVVKSVSYGPREGAEQSYIVTLDGQKVKDYVMKIYNLDNVKKGGKESDKKLLEDILSNMGDIESTIIIDEVQHQFSSLHADLTPQVRAAAKAVFKDMKEDSGMMAIIDASTIEINFAASNYGSVNNVVIPDDVLNNAVQKEIPKVSEQKK
ncbi:hypothetical protein D081_1544 [Anaerovibrio sp. JC8]|uniref:hypothetical protein n=1 Tax=Anaerovibrio sp. JC8 TaxID=1240085 RepID=UPI000A0C7D5A|nr:hypothetical protein [Anaerovibrio sp. JC8]ORT99963.1 hypothetical protein D081_1544 [Anaerovibrio sp. JC8]